MSDTNIAVTDRVWQYLDGLKGRNQSFDDVLRQELGIDEDEQAAHAAHAGQGASDE